jgi:hydroxymethylpyrimidine/phosphomethylpyrimidine kinase
VHVPPVTFLAEQLGAVSDDVDIDAVKIGMLADIDVIRTVSEWLDETKPAVVILDPVIVATSGDRLLGEDAEHALRELITRVHLVTPNIPELAILMNEPVAASWPEVLDQAQRLSLTYGVRVLAKGGHLDGAAAPDALVDGDAVTEFPGVRVATVNTHGTGCSYSSAIATQVAAGVPWAEAIAESKRWLTESIAAADELEVGTGHGPIHHFAGMWERGGLLTRPTPASVAELWWEQIHDIRTETDALPFVRGLGDGTLSRDTFVWYLAQDAF